MTPTLPVPFETVSLSYFTLWHPQIPNEDGIYSEKVETIHKIEHASIQTQCTMT